MYVERWVGREEERRRRRRRREGERMASNMQQRANELVQLTNARDSLGHRA